MSSFRRCRGDQGQAGGFEVIPFGVLVFVAGTLLVANLWAVVDAKMAATSAAREAARVYVEAPDGGSALAQAEQAADAALAARGRDPSRATVRLVEGDFGRCRPVVVEVAYTVPALSVPFLGRYGDGFVVHARHREIVDPYRSGLEGPADCG